MGIFNLDNGYNIHLMWSASGKASMFVYDTLKKQCNATNESILNVSKVSDVKNLLELVLIDPILADKWFIVLEYSTSLKQIILKHKGLFLSDTSVFLIKVKNYKQFLEVSEILSPLGVSYNKLYISRLRESDIYNLLDDFNLKASLLDFVSKSYSKDPERVFILREFLQEGRKVSTNKDIVKLIGQSSSSVNHVVFSLLRKPPTTERGYKMVLRGRVSEMNSLVESYGVSSTRNFMLGCVKDLLDIKTLYMQGVIYDTFRGIELPSCFDAKRLKKYEGYYLNMITTEIPYTRLVNLFLLLKEKYWYSDADMLSFIYKYYGGYVNGTLS